MKKISFKRLFDKFLTLSLNCKDMAEPYYMRGVQKQSFANVLQNRCS